MIAATNRNLQDIVKSGIFRADLFYRLDVFPMEVRRCASAKKISRCW
ncbi:MAG: sigma 54-interacting transcriptional regulator [Candidatus Binatia bacterium]